MLDFLRNWVAGWLAVFGGVVAVVLILRSFYLDVRALTTVGLLLVVVLIAGVVRGMAPAPLTSVVGALCLDLVDLPPPFKFNFHVDGAEDQARSVFMLPAWPLTEQDFSEPATAVRVAAR